MKRIIKEAPKKIYLRKDYWESGILVFTTQLPEDVEFLTYQSCQQEEDSLDLVIRLNGG